jgi:hypothetical protein
MSNTYYRGQGKVWIASRDSTGATSGFTEIGDADKLEITQSEQFDQVYESQSGARTKVVHSSTQLDVNFSLDILNFSGANLARAVLGSNASVAGSTVTGESVTVYKGQSSFLKYPGVSAVTIGTLVSGTDYTIDANTGRIDWLATGTTTDGTVKTVNYTFTLVDAVLEALTNTTNREYVLVFEGKNMNQNGTPVIVKAHRAYMNLAAAVALIGTATQKFSVSGALLPAPEITTVGVSPFYKVTIKDLN